MLGRKLTCVIVAAAGMLGTVSAANATTFTVGTVPNFYITSGTPFSPSITANFGNGFNSAVSFDDSFTFTIPTQSGIGSGSISTSFSSARNKLTITSLFINGTLFSVPSTGSGQNLSVGGIPITAGALNTIRVVGTTGRLGGTYSGTATFSATSAAVPEAATWAMMVGGFGAIGAATRRRRKTAVTFG